MEARRRSASKQSQIHSKADIHSSTAAAATPTKASASGNLESIDTRVPPSTMHDEDFADVVGKKPAVLLFATPALCQSRVCGPVVDIAEQVKARGPKGATFIHQEIYRDNEVSKGLRPQVLKWNLRSEPWLFVIDRRGRIASRIEGPFSVRELERALDAVARSGAAPPRVSRPRAPRMPAARPPGGRRSSASPRRGRSPASRAWASRHG